ncbi:N-lysine methyltransferase SMYD2-A [Halotydeus destructor]|nr:N-lysine methyltransferase SMYD2-A [Halotydeus destructor]
MVKFEAGDVITECSSYVHSVKDSQKGKFCDHCLKQSESLKRCSKCHEMYYCSRECQQKDWHYVHKLRECSILSTARGKQCSSLDTDFYRLLVRFVLKSYFDSECSAGCFALYDGHSRTIDDLMDHVDDLKDVTRIRALEEAGRHIVGLPIDLPVDLIVKRAHQLFTNSFQIMSENLERKVLGDEYEIALGLFVECSIFDHSCRPNASQTFDGSKIQIRALRTIDTDVEDITISYIDAMGVRKERVESLRFLHFFECTCVRCSDKGSNGDNFDDDEDKCVEFEELRSKYRLLDSKDRHCEAHNVLVSMVNIVTRVLGQFSAWKTELTWLTVQGKLLALQAAGSGRVEPEMVQLWNEFEACLSVTHGSEHSLNRSQMIQQLRQLFAKGREGEGDKSRD